MPLQCARPGARMNGAPSPKSAAFLAHLRIIRGDHRVFEPRKLINYLCNLQLILIGGAHRSGTTLLFGLSSSLEGTIGFVEERCWVCVPPSEKDGSDQSWRPLRLSDPHPEEFAGQLSAPAVASTPFRGIYASHSIHSTRWTSNSRKSQGSILTPLIHPVLSADHRRDLTVRVRGLQTSSDGTGKGLALTVCRLRECCK